MSKKTEAPTEEAAPECEPPKSRAGYNENGKVALFPADSTTQPQGDPSTMPNSEISTFFDTGALGVPADKNAHDDTFTFGPFQFLLRDVSAQIRAHDDKFPLRAIAELGLDARAAAELGEGFEDDDKEAQIARRARVLLDTEAFREDEALSCRFDALLNERFDAVIIGKPQSENDAEWGGLVRWASRVLPFSEENARALKLRVKVKIYERVMALSRYGIDDANFRRANSGGAR